MQERKSSLPDTHPKRHSNIFKDLHWMPEKPDHCCGLGGLLLELYCLGMLGRSCGLGGLLLELYCLGPALGRRCALEARLELCCLADERRLLLLSIVCLRVVTLRRILSPHALVPKVSIIMPD